MKNEILEEVWRVRDRFSKKHNYSLNAMVAALQEQEKSAPNPVVDRRPEAPNKTIQAAPGGAPDG